MKNRLIVGGVTAIALLAMAGSAFAQAASVNQAIPWQFRSDDPNATAVLQNGVVVMQAMRSHTLGQLSTGSSAGNGTGLFGASASATNNYTQNVTETVNNCAASGAGADLSCGGGAIRAVTTQTTSGSSSTGTTSATGNTVRSQQNSGSTINGQ
jgi:hypothetical protein